MRKLPPLHFNFSLAPDLSFDCSRVLELRKNMGCFAVCMSTTYFNPQSTKRHIIFQGWRQKIVQRLQLLFPCGVKGEWGEE